MSSRSARLARGSVAALISTFLAALSHLVAGGGGPGTVGLTVALTFSALVCIALAGKTLSTLRLGLAVILSQLIFHALFTVGGRISPPMAFTGMSGMSGKDHGATALIATADTRQPQWETSPGRARWLPCSAGCSSPTFSRPSPRSSCFAAARRHFGG